MSTIKTTYPGPGVDSEMITTYSLSPISNTTSYTLSGSTILAKVDGGDIKTDIGTARPTTNVSYEFSFARFKTDGYQQNSVKNIGVRCEWMTHSGYGTSIYVIGALVGEPQIYSIPIANCALSDKFKTTYDGAVARFYRNSIYVAGFSASLASYPNGKYAELAQNPGVVGDGQTDIIFSDLTGSVVAGVPSSSIKVAAGSGTSIIMG